jgi:hypothetical protein
MRSMKRVPIPLSAAVMAGIALWLSRASFDVAGTTAAPVRVAMLPSTAELAGLLTLTLLISAGIASLLRTNRTFWEPATDALLPLFTLSLLALPYLPWFADWLPALRLFAGPGRIVIWCVVVGQVLWILLPRLRPRAGLASPMISRANAAVLFGVVSIALSAPFVLNVRAVLTTFSRYFSPKQHNRPTSMEELTRLNDVALFDAKADPDELTNLAAQGGRHRELVLAMNEKLNRLIDDEVGEDRGQMMPGGIEAGWEVTPETMAGA